MKATDDNRAIQVKLLARAYGYLQDAYLYRLDDGRDCLELGEPNHSLTWLFDVERVHCLYTQMTSDGRLEVKSHVIKGELSDAHALELIAKYAEAHPPPLWPATVEI